MIKVGVVGLGAMGQHHVRLYSRLNCKLVGIADINTQRAKEMGEQHRVSYYSDYHELIGKIDAVSIAVPTTLHNMVAIDFLKEGVHCLVEKPIASTLDEAEEMIITSDENHGNLAIGHIEQFNPAVLKLKQIIEENVLGQLLIISTRRVGPFSPRIRDVGVVIDSATHDIGVIQNIIRKEPLSIFSRVGSFNHTRNDYAIIVLDFGKTASCSEVNWFNPNKVRTLVATGSEGIAYLDYIEQSVIIHNSRGIKVVEINKMEPLRIEIEDFLKTIEEGKKPSVSGREGTQILRIALEASSNNYLLTALN